MKRHYRSVWRAIAVTTGAVSLLVASAAVRAPLASAEPIGSNTGTYYPVASARLLDTRTGTGAPLAKLGPGGQIDLAIAGHGGVPATGVNAVVLNVTVTNPTAGSFLTVWPEGVNRPTASSLNFVAGWTGANMVTVGLGATGEVSIFNAGGTVDVIADLVGFYAADDSMMGTLGSGAHYYPTDPFRAFDTREDLGFRIPAGGYLELWFNFAEFEPYARALAVNVTAVDAVGAGFLTAYAGSSVPLASTLNYTAGGVVPNMAVVPLAPCELCPIEQAGWPAFRVYTPVAAHIIVDVMGSFEIAEIDEGLRFSPNTPERIVDSRIPQGLPGALGADSTGTVTVPGSIAAEETFGVALNVTAVTPTANGYVSVWPGGDRPLVSSLNTAPGQTLPNSVYTLISVDSGFNVYNAAGTTHLVADVVGTFYLESAIPPAFSAGHAGLTPRLTPRQWPAAGASG